jgi:UDP-N-acetylenolpyruvoylglucosamine reductase
MQVYTHHQLKQQLTSGVSVIAQKYIVLESMEDIPAALLATATITNPRGTPDYILGGGSNVVPV